MMPNNCEAVPILSQWQALLSHPSLLTVLTDARGIIQALGSGASQALGYPKDALNGQLINARLYDKYDVRQRARELSKSLDKEVKPGFSVLIKKLDEPRIGHWLRQDKSRLSVKYSATHVACAETGWEGYLFVGVPAQKVVALTQEVADLQTKLAVANAKIAALTVTDEITGLKNNRAFEQCLESEFKRTLRHHSPLSVLLLTWNGYQESLVKYGPEVSNTMLKVMADAQLKQNRSTDFLAHLGGGVMAYVLPETDSAGAGVKGRRLAKLLGSLSSNTGRVAVSIGIASLGQQSPAVHGVTRATTLVQRAREALSQGARDQRVSITFFEDHSENTEAQKLSA